MFLLFLFQIYVLTTDTSKVASFDEEAIRWKSPKFQEVVPLFGGQTHSNIMYKAVSFQKPVHTLKVHKNPVKFEICRRLWPQFSYCGINRLLKSLRKFHEFWLRSGIKRRQWSTV